MITTLTPRYYGQRININVQGEVNLPRGRRWQKTVTSTAGNKFVLRGATCGLPKCYCDAVIVDIK